MKKETFYYVIYTLLFPFYRVLNTLLFNRNVKNLTAWQSNINTTDTAETFLFILVCIFLTVFSFLSSFVFAIQILGSLFFLAITLNFIIGKIVKAIKHLIRKK